MKKSRLLSLLLGFILLTGCVGSSITPHSDGATADAAPGESAITSDVGDNGEVVMVNEPGEYPDCRPFFDGSVRFEKDSAYKASVDFPADGTEQSVELQDGNGLTWKLIIPANALDHPQKIGMTAMTNISSDLGKISGGIVLSPDGLRFSAPVTLTVSGAGVGSSGLLFSGNDKGEELELSIVQREGDAVEMKLLHFSTAYASDDQAIIDKISESARDSIRKLSALAKQILKRPIEVPVPPAIPIQCHHETEDQDAAKLEKYAKDFGKPELDLLSALHAAYRNIALTTGEQTDFALMQRLNDRLVKKGNMLIKQYKGQEEMFSAVAAVTLNAERQAALLSEPLTEEQSFIPVLAMWAQSISQKYLDGLVRNHEYKNIHPAMNMIRTASVLSAPDASRLNQDFADACTFTLRFEGTSTQKRDSVSSWGTSGECKLSLSGSDKAGLVFEGKGTGTHDSYSSSDPSAVKVLLTKEFDTEVYLILNPTCYLTGRAGVTRLGADELTYQSDDGPVTAPSFYNLINQLVLGEHYDAALQAVMAEITLTSGEAVIEKVIDGSHEYTSIVYTISLEHTPEKGS